MGSKRTRLDSSARALKRGMASHAPSAKMDRYRKACSIMTSSMDLLVYVLRAVITTSANTRTERNKEKENTSLSMARCLKATGRMRSFSRNDEADEHVTPIF